MEWIYDGGGRSKYFKATDVSNCAVRAIAIGTGKDYKEVYDALKQINNGKSCRNGKPKNVDKKIMKQSADQRCIWKAMVNGNIETAYYIAADSEEEAIEIATYKMGIKYNCAVIMEDY